MRVLVLGGNRDIGLSLVFELARRGHTVTVMTSHVAPLPDADRQEPGIMARAVGVEPRIVSVPLDLARTLQAPLVPWGEAIMGGTVLPRFGLEDGFRDSYRWFRAEGRDRYEFDFRRDDELQEASA